MIDKLKKLEARYASLNLRERWMVFFAGLAVIYGVMDTLLLTPASTKHQNLTSELAGSQQALSDMQQQIKTLTQMPIESVDAQNKKKIEKLNTSIGLQKEQFLALHKTIVSADDITDLLKSLMRNFEGVRLVRMKTLAPENYLNNVNSANAGNGSANHASHELNVIYKHGLELTFSGQYMELMRYAEALQEHSDKVLWDKAELKTKAFPLNELTITVYTLSLDKTWLSI